MRVLVVEDDARIAADVCKALRAAGYVTETASDGENAWFLGDTEDYDAVVLDLGLPHMDGLTVLKKWREAKRNLPVIALTARGSWMERVEGIDAGADDYLPKPFRMEELVARLRALVRRSAGHGSPLLTVGDLSLDERQMRVSLAGVPVDLAPLEYRAIAYLMHNQGRVVSQAELSEHIHGAEDAYDSNAIEALIARVRRKIDGDVIKTRRGFGYIIAEPGS
ncbi:response regulator transcription factor [Hyphomicrobium sp. 99]|uniref:response regulator transcription factor n=1 Tax=Hyphomicrobium sp. 99 TaxID=1163419 RepID=UPI0005F78A3B|nr:response regulator transcription factor [Hyphomicrobium sp. 99]